MHLALLSLEPWSSSRCAMAPAMGKAASGGSVCRGSGGDLLSGEVFPEAISPLSQLLWDPLPFIII